MKLLASIFAGAALASAVASAADFAVARSTNQVGLELYHQLAGSSAGENLVISPYSIESALALVYAGADGATRSELARALHFPPDDASLAREFSGLRAALEPRAAQPQTGARPARQDGGRSDGITWHVANRLFGQRGYAFRKEFLSLMAEKFDAPFGPLDFQKNPEAARGAINAWVEEQTRQKITRLVPPGALSTSTRLVLVNALYLKAPWQKNFPKTETAPRPFHRTLGDTPDVATMRRTALLPFAQAKGFTAVALDYLGGGLQFLILLPDAGENLDAAVARLTADDLARWCRPSEEMPPKSVTLFLPKFRVEGATLSLRPALQSLGVKSAFDEPTGSANFDRIAPRPPKEYLALADVFHQTIIAVDEDGTEAAAATAASMALTLSAQVQPERPVEVRVDRPFLFAVQHRASGVCLFLGRIGDPR